jgi:hypothetical protein
MRAWHDCKDCIHAKPKSDGLLYCCNDNAFSGSCVEYSVAMCSKFKKKESEGEHD